MMTSKQDYSSHSERHALKPKISMITLGVRDLAASLAFYRDGLGFPTDNYVEGQDCIMFKLEGTWLALYPRASLADDATVDSRGSGFAGFALAHNVGSKTQGGQDFRDRRRGWSNAGEGATGCVLGWLFELLCRS